MPRAGGIHVGAMAAKGRRSGKKGAIRVSPEALLQHSRWLATLARALVHGDADAADVVQQTFERALASPPTSARNLRGWLRRTASNVVRAQMRSKRRRELRELIAPRPEPLASPAESVARADLHRRVVEAVLALPEPYRGTLVMRYFDELGADEIAKATSVPIETVRTRIKRGLKQLRSRLKKEFQGHDRDWVGALAPLLRRHRPAVIVGVASVMVMSVLVWNLHDRRRDELSFDSRNTAVAVPTTHPSVQIAAHPSQPERTIDGAAFLLSADSRPQLPDPDSSVQCAIVGTVRDDRGRPVAGAWVGIGRSAGKWLGGWHYGDWFTSESELVRANVDSVDDHLVNIWRRLRTTTTGMDGSYRFNDVNPYTNWNVGAFKRGSGVASVTGVPLDHPGGSDVVDLDLIRCPRILGRVTTLDGSPVPHALIEIVAWLPSMKARSFESCISSSDPAHEGEYTIDCIPGCRFEMQARTVDGLDSEPICLVNAPGTDELHADLRVVEDLRKHPRGRILSSSGGTAHLAYALMPRLVPEERTSPWREPFSVVLLYDRPTRVPCSIHECPGSRCGRVLVDRDEYTIDVTEVLEQPNACVAFVIRDRLIGIADVSNGREPPGLIVHLDEMPEAPPPRQLGTVEVCVHGATDADDLDRSRVDISFELIDRDLQQLVMRPRELGDGRYDFTDLPRCSYRIRADCDGFMPETRKGVISPDCLRTTYDLPLRRAVGPIRGAILSTGGMPIQDAEIRLYEWNKEAAIATAARIVRSNLAGRFEFDALAGGHYLIVARTEEYAPEWKEVSPGAENRPIELRLAAGINARVRLAATDTSSFQNVQWRILDSSGVPLIDDRFPDHDYVLGLGNCRDGRLPRGRFTVEVWSLDHAGRGEIEVGGGNEAIVEMYSIGR